MSTDLLTILRRIETRLARLESSIAAAPADDDRWTRVPAQRPDSRCPVSNWSYATIYRQIRAGKVRSKTVGGSRFYSAADVARLMSSEPEGVAK